MKKKEEKFDPQKQVLKLRRSKAFRKAYQDNEFMDRPELRPVRLQLELLKPEMILQEHHISETIVVFGSARIWSKEKALQRVKDIEALYRKDPGNSVLKNKLGSVKRLVDMSKYYEIGREFGRLVAEKSGGRFIIVTGGGPGIMESANRGSFEGGAKSIGLNITLPMEQGPNPYVSPEFAFRFHYFAIRKMHFMMRSRALVVFPGGFGTFDELYEALTLVQTGKKRRYPVIMIGRKFWTEVVNLDALARYGVISQEDKNLMHYADSAQEAWDIIAKHYSIGEPAPEK